MPGLTEGQEPAGAAAPGEQAGAIVFGEPLRTVTAALLDAATLAEVVTEVLATVLPAVGAARGSVGVLGHDGRGLDVWRRATDDPDVVRRVQLGHGDDLPGPTTVRDETERWYESVAAVGGDFPAVVGRLPDLGPDHACAWLPLVGAGGRRFGFLALQFAEAGWPGDEHRELVRATTAQCATALERALLHESDQLAHERLQRVADVTAMLAAAETRGDVADVLVRHGVDAFSATAGAVHLLDDDGWLVLAGSRGWPERETARFERFHRDDELPAAEALRRRTTMVFTSGEELRRAYPALAPVQAAVGLPAWVMAPILAGRDPLGVLGLSFAGERHFSGPELQLLVTLAATAGQALERAGAHEAVQSIALELQRALLPTGVPEHAAFAATGAYVPAPGPAEVGGDWYEVLLGDDDALFVIGDVAGHGVDAARTMAAVRHGLAALALAERDPGRLLAGANRYLRTVGVDTMVTCCVVRLAFATRVLTFATAGHPPPALAGAGAAAHLRSPVGPPLGVIGDAGYRTTSQEAAGGATLVLYTDGLVERRGEPINDGLARLLDAVAACADRPPPAVCDALLTGLAGGATDDVALLVVAVA